tara:strand:- start:84 stop:581 length:498 start_codon:yes stop_codon:yes gene_type:complete
MQEHSLAINYDLGTNTVTDCLPMDTFDVSALKKESPDGPVMDVAPGDAEIDARAQELTAIEDFIAKNGVSVPTAEDFKPKKVSWRGKKSKKTDGQVEKERRGRPRTKYTKTMTFVMLDADTFKRAGRGRAKVGELRRAFEIHHTHVDAVSVGTWTCDELLKMASV